MTIEEMVMHRYPKDEKERKCAAHRQRMQALRDAYRQRLLGGIVAEGDINNKEGKEIIIPNFWINNNT